MKKLALIALAGVASTLMFVGCMHKKSPAEKAAWIVEEITEELELNEEQQGYLNEMKVLLVEKYAKHKALKEKKHTELKTKFLNENFTEDEFGVFVDEHAEKIKGEGQEVWNLFVKLQASLAPEQREKVVGHFETFKKHGKHCSF